LTSVDCAAAYAKGTFCGDCGASVAEWVLAHLNKLGTSIQWQPGFAAMCCMKSDSNHVVGEVVLLKIGQTIVFDVFEEVMVEGFWASRVFALKQQKAEVLARAFLRDNHG